MPDYEKMSIKRLRYCLRRAQQTRQHMRDGRGRGAGVWWLNRFCKLNTRIRHIREVERRYFQKRQELLQLILCCRHSTITLNVDVLSHIFKYL